MEEEQEKEVKLEGGCATLLLLLAGIVFLILLNVFVAMSFWQWFAVPLGAPTISGAHALGISMLVGIFTGIPQISIGVQSLKPKKEGNEAVTAGFNQIKGSIAFLTVSWILGYLLQMTL